jgi:hypothetical protein
MCIQISEIYTIKEQVDNNRNLLLLAVNKAEFELCKFISKKKNLNNKK